MKEKIIDFAKKFWEKVKEVYVAGKDILEAIWVKVLTWVLENPEKFGMIAGFIFCISRIGRKDEEVHEKHAGKIYPLKSDGHYIMLLDDMVFSLKKIRGGE